MPVLYYVKTISCSMYVLTDMDMHVPYSYFNFFQYVLSFLGFFISAKSKSVLSYKFNFFEVLFVIFFYDRKVNSNLRITRKFGGKEFDWKRYLYLLLTCQY